MFLTYVYYVSDSITSISCEFVVHLLRDLLFVLQLVVDFCCGLAAGFRFVVDLSLYNKLYDKSK